MESYAAGETEPPLLEETIGGNFDRTVAAYPDREALVEFASGRRWTYRELNHDVDLFARGLIAGGLAKGDRIGVWAPSCAEWTIAQLATAKIGAILVNVNPSYRTHEFTYAVNQSGLRLLIAAENFKTSDYRSMIEETAADTPRLERVVYIGTSDWTDVVEAGWVLAFDTGEKVPVDGVVLVGRRPSARPGEAVRHLVALPSQDMSLSKTHAQIGVAGDGALVVMDRGSTNGSVLTRQGVSRPLSGGKPTTLLEGDLVRFGDRSMEVSRQG